MKVQANSRIEGIFALAVAMDNRGMKNTIHCIGSNIFITNFDHSMILRFSLRQNEATFAAPVSFNANEYDSPDFTFAEGDNGPIIVFHTDSKEYKRKKICRPVQAGPDAKTINQVYRTLKKEAASSKHLFYLSAECCPLLEEELSHTEISVEKSKLILRQRNVYTGTIVEITPKGEAGFFTVDNLPQEMLPIALKTKDFISLFSIRKSLACIPTLDFLMVKDPKKGDFDGILALCRYDMIIDMYRGNKKEDEINGRQEQETRASEQTADRPHQKSEASGCRRRRK